MEMNLAWPWMLLLVPLPLLAYWRKQKESHASQDALVVPFFTALTSQTLRANWNPSFFNWKSLLTLFAWALLCLAAARPQWIGEPIAMPQEGRDIMLAVDLSASMTEPMNDGFGRAITRLELLKQVASKFIDSRVGDRIGLILFGDNAYIQAPISFDRHTINQFLQESLVGFAGKRTAMGDAIVLAIQHLQNTDERSRVLVLVTDGEDTASTIPPDKAAELAASIGLKVYTIGVGDNQPQTTNFIGLSLGQRAGFDEATLKEIAKKTGGQYFLASDRQSMQSVYEKISQLEPVAGEDNLFRPSTEMFFYPLAFAFALALMQLTVSALLSYRSAHNA